MTARVIWTDIMDNALRSLRNKGKPIMNCAWEIGVAYPTALNRARELGIADRRNRGNKSGERCAVKVSK